LAEGVIAAGLSPQDRQLLTTAQVAFPLAPRPFAALGEIAGLREEQVIARLHALKEERLIRRIGPVFEPAALGLVTGLVAVEVEADRIAAVGAEIATWPQVTHCYQRNHRVGLWLAGAARSADWFGQASAEISGWEGVRGAWRLPTTRRFKIGVIFDLVTEQTRSDVRAGIRGNERPAHGSAGPADTGLVRVLETELPLTPEPFAALAAGVPAGMRDLLGTIREWLALGRMRRYGAQLNHRLLGFTANAMTVWAVPADRMEEVGGALAEDPEVSHCYQRPTFNDFPYNLYAMIHGRSREHCLAAADRLTRACGLSDPLPLFSTREFKKSTPPYSDLMAGPRSSRQ